jgi:DNA-binding MarR family transcriptional regulator
MEPRWLSEHEAKVWQDYRDLSRELMAALERQLIRDAGLSGADYQLLVPLSEAPDGLLRARDLGAVIGWERSRISHQVRRMAERGLLVREDCPEDARGAMIRLTDTGRAAIVGAAPNHVETVRSYFFDQLSANDVKTLGRICARLLAQLPKDRSAV